MSKKLKAILTILFSFCFCFMCVGYSTLAIDLTVSGSAEIFLQEGVFISSVNVECHEDAKEEGTVVNNYTFTTCDSVLTLSDTNENSYVLFNIRFYNNSESKQIYSGAKYISDAYSNNAITFDVDGEILFVNPYDYVTLQVKFYYKNGTVATNNVLESTINYSFKEMTGTSVSAVIEGNSADNMDSVADGNSNYDGSNTSNRWTNWTSETSGRGVPATISIVMNEKETIDSVKLYHFIDANSNVNWYGSCDFPDNIEIYYYDDQLKEYLPITFTESQNWTNASRRARDGVYTMRINGTTATFTHTYRGTPPITTCTFDAITTQALKIVLTPKANFFVGLMEIEVNSNGNNVLVE